MKKSKTFLLISFLFIAGNFIWLLFFDVYNPNPKFKYDKYYNFEASIKYQDKKLNGWNIRLADIYLDNFSGDILIYVSLYPEYKVGDVLEVSCKISKPQIIESEDGKSFSYDKFLAKDGIYGICFRPKIKVIDQHKDFNFYLANTKNYLWTNLNNNLTEPSSSIAKAITLGTRKEIPDNLRNIFARTGLSHIIAISGLHMAIIIFLLQYFLIFIGLNRKQSIVFLFFIIFAYLYILNFPSSALRASCMMLVLLVGPLIGRQTLSVFSLILVADVFILFNKYLLLYDIGFQLSFLAVLGILLYVDYFKKILVFIPQVLKIREVFAVTLAAQVFTWPIIVYNFQIFSIISPVANFLILPILPIVLVLSFALAIFGSFEILATIFLWPIIIIFKLINDIVVFLSKIPYAFFVIENFDLKELIISYVFIIIITFILKPHEYKEN